MPSFYLCNQKDLGSVLVEIKMLDFKQARFTELNSKSNTEWLLFIFFIFFLQVKYFTKRRDFLKYKERMQTEGFTPAEGPQKPS